MTLDAIPVWSVAAMTLATILLGAWATRRAKTAADFFVAGRSVGVGWNASAISGEYLSAASFLGIAGLVMKNGYDALWYPVCYATGYLFLLLFIAGPLRRFGAYTIPDFAEGRFDSPNFRKVAVTFVLFIGFFYTMPQMKGAGVTMNAILGWPYWAGIAAVSGVITFNVAFGGMKGITLVQAFQYWAKLFAIAAPLFVLMTVYGGYGTNLAKNHAAAADPVTPQPETANGTARDPIAGFWEFPPRELRVERDTPITIRPGLGSLAFSTAGPATLEFPDGATLASVYANDRQTPADLVRPGKGRVAPGLRGVVVQPDGRATVPPGGTLLITPYTSTQSSSLMLHGPLVARIDFGVETRAILKANSFVPNAPDDSSWVRPFGPMTSKHGHPLLYTYSLIIALICGTAGLPHILVRFYTNPDGRAAKRTTLWVMVMLGTFYVFPPIWGALGRNLMTELYATGKTDTVVIRLPTILANPLWAQIGKAITAAGAFAAFMSTFSGLLVSMSGAVAHDIYGKILAPQSSPRARLVAFQLAAVAIGTASVGLGLLVESFDITMLVGWAFAIAACSYFPLLLLGAWWRGLTVVGAAVGMLGGGLLALGSIIATMLMDKHYLPATLATPLGRSLMEQPAIWGVPLALGLMVVGSKCTPERIPPDVDLKMLRLHAPEELGLSKNYIDQ